jgi:hypothetical protein
MTPQVFTVVAGALIYLAAKTVYYVAVIAAGIVVARFCKWGDS